MENKLRIEAWVNGILVGDEFESYEEAYDEAVRVARKNWIEDEEDMDIRYYEM